jgi:hypothetical protein
MSGGSGTSIWHYELVAFVQPGDVIFHWHTTLLGKPALVGWSVATGPLREELHPWTAHAGVNSQESAVPRPNWVMPLGGLHYFERPVFGPALDGIRDGILDLKAALEANYPGFRYFPFNKYGAGHIRASQAYATKFPRELMELFVSKLGLDFDLDEAGSADLKFSPPPNPASAPSTGGQGFARDTARKIAVENYAVDRAIEFYAALGATEIVVLGAPYDLKIQLAGEEVHVEVKGSTTEAAKVFVTAGEVRHAANFPRVDLVVVDQIQWSIGTDEAVIPFGGRMRRWPDWTIHKSSLAPVTYAHTLSPESEPALDYSNTTT